MKRNAIFYRVRHKPAVRVENFGTVLLLPLSFVFTGVNWRDSLQLGALTNTRGLMALIVQNIGCDPGIQSPRIFAMLVIMALVTTAMTGPLLTWFQRLPGRDGVPDRLVRS